MIFDRHQVFFEQLLLVVSVVVLGDASPFEPVVKTVWVLIDNGYAAIILIDSFGIKCLLGVVLLSSGRCSQRSLHYRPMK